ncbi:50S ribosomal protein L21 [Candidatus Parcubacteria bacterium]|nr:50S ribosomal protein L21 [Candidatus Parcubacteria bacterium]
MKEFAVIFTGGKQYKVSEGDEIAIEKLSDEAKAGDAIVFDKVLVVDNGQDTTLGTPYISGAKVTATVLQAGRAKKVEVVKYKAKSRYYKNRGHRQPFTKVKIEKLS